MLRLGGYQDTEAGIGLEEMLPDCCVLRTDLPDLPGSWNQGHCITARGYASHRLAAGAAPSTAAGKAEEISCSANAERK